MTEFLRMSGIYWGLTAMDLMGQLSRMNKEEVLEFVKACQHHDGGFGPTLHQDSHLLYTLSAIQAREASMAEVSLYRSPFSLTSDSNPL